MSEFGSDRLVTSANIEELGVYSFFLSHPICNELNVTRVENIDISEISMPEPYIVPENMLWRVNVLKELLDCRDHHCESLMAPEDISDFITIVACA